MTNYKINEQDIEFVIWLKFFFKTFKVFTQLFAKPFLVC